MMTILLLVVACAKAPTESPRDIPAAAPGVSAGREQTEPAAPPVFMSEPAPPPASSPAGTPPDAPALYAACQERVEGKTAPGECKVDGDCAKAGCSSEVCVATVNAADVITSCDVLPCFAVLKACGCVDTQCKWEVSQ